MAKTLFAVIITLALTATRLDASTPEQTAEIDSILELAEIEYGTGEGMRLLDLLEKKGHEYGHIEAIENAIMYKLGTFINTGNYNRVEELYDSIVGQANIEKDMPGTYYYAMYVQTMSKIYQSNYRQAIEIAQILYEHSIGPEAVKGKDIKELDARTIEELRNRITALRCLGAAYGGMHQTDVSLRYLDESVEVAETYTEFIHELADVCNDRMQIAGGIDNMERRLEYTRHLEDVIKRLMESNGEEDLNIAYYTLCIEGSYTKAYCLMDDYENATIHMTRLRDMLRDPELMVYYRDKYYEMELAYHNVIKDYEKAIAYSDTAMRIARHFGEKARIIGIMNMRASAFKGMGDYKRAFTEADSIIYLTNKENKKQLNSAIEQMSVMVDMNRLKMEKERAESDRAVWILVALLSFVGAVAVIIGITTYQNRRRMSEKQRILSAQKQMLLEEVEVQTSELREKNKIIEQKNTDITASINYALRIQKAMLPDVEKFTQDNGLKGSFVYYRPCDIVSGDFYWVKKHDDNIIMVCADCTGHGVPGAMLSMTGTTLLNDITAKSVLPEAGEILEKLDRHMRTVLTNSYNAEVIEGMDLALAIFNTKTRHLKVTNAKRISYLVKGGEIVELKANHRSIGEIEERRRQRKFETEEFTVDEGDTLYMFSDGITDQFGGQEQFGREGRLLTARGLKEILSEISPLAIEEQEKRFDELFEKWRGSIDQVDDIALMGVRF